MFRESSLAPPFRPDGGLTTYQTGWLCSSTRGVLGKVEAMAEPIPTPQAEDLQGEQVRKQRLRADGLRPLAVNLRETISLTHKLFELRDAALRAR